MNNNDPEIKNYILSEEEIIAIYESLSNDEDVALALKVIDGNRKLKILMAIKNKLDEKSKVI